MARTVRHTLSMTVIICCCLLLSALATSQPWYPPVTDVSRDRPVTSFPAAAVCGLPTESVYCRSTRSPESVRQCLLDVCTSECPGRSDTPSHVALLTAGTASTSCVVRRDGTTYSVVFPRSINTTPCYIQLQTVSLRTPQGSFTLTFWVWLDSNSKGLVCLCVCYCCLNTPHQSVSSVILVQPVLN